MNRIVIVGGGITGLAAAWELQQQGADYVLLEASPRLGGKIVTEYIDGFTIEGAADSFLTQKPWAWQLCREIGLQDRLIGTNEAQRQVYVLHGGKLQPMPRGLRLIVPLEPDGLLESPLLSDEGKRRMLAETDVPPRLDHADESLAAFVRRRFGQEALDLFGESLLAGIHVSDPETLSMQAAFPNYVKLEREYGSVIRGMREGAAAQPIDPDAPRTTFVSLRNGLSELIAGLQARLNGDVRTGQAAIQIDSDGTLHTSTGEKMTPEAIILTLPARAAGRLIESAIPAAASILGTFTTTSSGTVSLGYRAAEIDHPLDGFGFVVPHGEARILASTWSSTKLPYRAPDGHVLIRVFVGGYEHPADIDLSDTELIALARSELKRIMGIQAVPVVSRVFRWRDANPQYAVGHLDRLAELAALSPAWLHLAGCSYTGVGIPDCVRQGRQAARRALHLVP